MKREKTGESKSSCHGKIKKQERARVSVKERLRNTREWLSWNEIGETKSSYHGKIRSKREQEWLSYRGESKSGYHGKTGESKSGRNTREWLSWNEIGETKSSYHGKIRSKREQEWLSYRGESKSGYHGKTGESKSGCS